MADNRFRKAEPHRKRSQCSCGKEAKLINRRNYPHGRNSPGLTLFVYKCSECKKETPLVKAPVMMRR